MDWQGCDLGKCPEMEIYHEFSQKSCVKCSSSGRMISHETVVLMLVLIVPSDGMLGDVGCTTLWIWLRRTCRLRWPCLESRWMSLLENSPSIHHHHCGLICCHVAMLTMHHHGFTMFHSLFITINQINNDDMAVS